jgi:CubicO group peptidase (beta-lactamase class C family)
MTKQYGQKTWVTGIFFLLCCTLQAQTDSIDLFIRKEMQQRRIPGLQLAVIKNGIIIKTGNYGLANVQDSVPVTDKTVFTINSITKAFTGVAIMQLVEAGKLSLTARVSEYISSLPAAWQDITIQQLLSHISGLPDIVDEETMLIAADPEEAWKKVKAMPMDGKPGEKFIYNQTNYLLLGYVINRLSGMPFQEFITREQLQKVGMWRTTTAGFGATKEVIAHAAVGYRYAKGKLNNTFFSFPSFLQTAAGMSSTANEMAQWVMALQSGRLLKKESIATMWAPAKLNNGKTAGFSAIMNGYGAGWPVVGREKHPAATAVGGARSALFIYPDDKITIVILTNLLGASPENFMDELAALIIPGMK